MEETTSKLLVLDSRQRVSLGYLARYKHYLAKCEADGTIVLTPAVLVRVGQVEDSTTEERNDAGIQ